MQLKQGIANRVVFLLVDPDDHTLPVTGIAPTVQISANGGPFVQTVNSPAEIGHGWYSVLLTPNECVATGPLILRVPALEGVHAEWRDLHEVAADTAVKLSDTVDGGVNVLGALRILLAVLAGTSAGGGTDHITFHGVGGTSPRIQAEVDGFGNRMAVMLDVGDG